MLPGQQSLHIGEWVVDPDDDSLTRDGQMIRIEPRMMRLLLCLAKSSGKVLSQEQLLNEVWSGVVVGPASIYQSVSQLRKVLGDTESPPTYIETVARKGYRLVAPVRTAAIEQFSTTPTPEAAPPLTPEPAEVGTDGNRVALPAAHSRRWLKWALAAGLVCIVVAALLWQRMANHTAELLPASIVVLPFVDMTNEKTEQPFCDGLTEELSNWLAQIPTLKVVARTSAFAFRNRDIDVREIGRTLGTTHVLEGSLRRSEQGVRVTVQLINARDGFHVWSHSYDVEQVGIVQVQEQVARSVAMNLELRLSPTTSNRFADRHGTNATAYTSYLLARHHNQQLTGEDNDRAIQLYEAAIADDPKFALAKVGLASALINERYFNDRAIDEIAPRAKALLDSAAQLTPNLPDLYIVRGALATELHERKTALADLQRAAELNPNSSYAASELGFYYLTAGEPMTSLDWYTKAANLDPIAFNVHAARCVALADLARFDEGSLACERARALNPAATWSFTASGLLEHSRGHVVEALAWNKAALSRSPTTVDSYAERARWLIELGALDQARAEHQAAFEIAGIDAARSAPLLRIGLLTSAVRGGSDELERYIALHSLEQATAPAILFEVAAAQLLIDDAPAAKKWIDRALTSPALTDEDLESAWSARTGGSPLVMMATVSRAMGDEASAARYLKQVSRLIERLKANGMRRHGLSELEAQVAAASGDQERAIGALRQAAHLGWRSVWLAEHEPYLRSIRERTEVRALFEEVQASNARDISQLMTNGPGQP